MIMSININWWLKKKKEKKNEIRIICDFHAYHVFIFVIYYSAWFNFYIICTTYNDKCPPPPRKPIILWTTFPLPRPENVFRTPLFLKKDIINFLIEKEPVTLYMCLKIKPIPFHRPPPFLESTSITKIKRTSHHYNTEIVKYVAHYFSFLKKSGRIRELIWLGHVLTWTFGEILLWHLEQWDIIVKKLDIKWNFIS